MKNGIICIHKPEGISSAAVVARVKKHLKARKVGHCGTLDPFATGLLLCAVNQGTRISQFLLEGKKGYRATICLGAETDTYDLTGKVVSSEGIKTVSSLDPERIRQVVRSFIGPQDQVPPVYSALKHKGQPLYKLARKGIQVEKPPRKIEIFNIRIHGIELPEINMEVDCSAGTYIRSLAFDIGRKLGCGAHLSALCRTRSSHFQLENAISLDHLEKTAPNEIYAQMTQMSEALSFLPGIQINREMQQKVRFGQRLPQTAFEKFETEDGRNVRLLDEKNRLLAIVKFDEAADMYNYCCVFSD